eukprot:COSAG01_NODE_39467_length_476_cov_0.663130_1_plen_38_part_01
MLTGFGTLATLGYKFVGQDQLIGGTVSHQPLRALHVWR